MVLGALLYIFNPHFGLINFYFNQSATNSYIASFGFCFGVFILLKILSFIKARKEKQEAINKKSVGDKYEELVGQCYENLGYKVKFRGLELGKLDGGIDLIAKRENELLLIQCRYWYKNKSINHQMIKEFYGSCHIYMNKQNFSEKAKKEVKCIYVVPSYNTLHYSAIAIFKENYNYLRYKIIEANIKP